MRLIINQIIKIPDVIWKWLYFVTILIIALIEANGRSDFDIYQLASKDVFNHINPYNHSYIDGYYYYYSLLFTYLIYPFTFLPAYWSTFLWLFINGILLYYIIAEISDFIGTFKYSYQKQLLFFLLLILFNIRTIRENFHSAQITIFILFLMMYSLKFLHQNKIILSAVLLALAINIKLLALPILVYYLYRGYIKVFIYAVIFVVIFFVLPAFFMDKNFYLDCIQHWWLLINPDNNKHIIDVDERSFHSITTLITTLFMKNPPDIYALPIRRYIADLSFEQIKWIIQIIRLILMFSVLIIIRDWPFKKVNNSFQLFFEWSYVISLIPLIFPHQQHYAFLLQMPALAILIFYLINYQTSISFKIILAIIFLCFNLKIILGVWNDYYEHFKILTYGGLLVILMLQLLRFRINQNNFSQ